MKLLAIDGNSLINRAYYGVRSLNNKSNTPTNAVYGFVNMLLKLLEDEQPEQVCVCFDLRAKTFRHKMFDGYKAHRTGMPEELVSQMPIIKNVLDLMGISRLELEGYEADDLLGTLARKCTDAGQDCVIVTGDRDSLQFIAQGATTKLVITKAGKTTYKDYREPEFSENYCGLTSDKIIDLKALMGDSSDNIPGVLGIGEKTALNLICEFGSLDGVYENLDSPKITASVRKKLETDEANARMSFALASGDIHVPFQQAPADFVRREQDKAGLYTEFEKLEFGSLIKRMHLSAHNTAVSELNVEAIVIDKSYEQITDFAQFEKILAECKAQDCVSCVIAPNLDAGVVFYGDNCYAFSAISFADNQYKLALATLFGGEINLVMHDCKHILVELLSWSVLPRGVMFDTKIAAYLLEPTSSEYSIETCANEILAAKIMNSKLYCDDGAFSQLSANEDFFGAMAQHSRVVSKLYVEYSKALENTDMRLLFDTIEMPLITVLAHMQHYGFAVDRKRLLDFGTLIGARIEELTAKIYLLAEEEFNINSTKVLGAILFEKLNLPTQKKTKTGYSTDIDVLEKLRDSHEIIGSIIEYRKLSKLKSTYVDGLVKVIASDMRIHSTFQQTITATGRLSSTDPNLQNLPIRREEGAEIRRSFVAREGCILIDADYSQIELRILAHIACDKIMLEAFETGEDIHSVTASQVFDMPLEMVTPQMRSHAKAVNFGIVYGISAFSLADDIKVSNKEAQQYIDNYLKKYSGVSSYMDSIREKAKRDGYVTTLCGRRRYLPELTSKSFNVRSFGERVALNTPIQGTAADVMKIAMINVFNRIARENLGAKLLLQVHDELIIEAPLSEEAQVRMLLSEEMENALKLSVRLRADVSSGDNWYDAKK